MSEEAPVHPAKRRLSDAIGHGTIYTVLGVAVLASLAVAFVLGLQGIVGPGLFADRTAFAVGGIALVVVAVAVLVLLFSLTGTIRYVNREMQDLTRLRERIETSYARLAGATEQLGGELRDLRQVLGEQRRRRASSRDEPAQGAPAGPEPDGLPE